MSFDGRAVANYVLDRCAAKGRAISNLQLQKIVYFCHVWSLIKLNKPLVKHQFEAWQHGPVLQYLYHDFKEYDRQPIKGRALSLDVTDGKKKIASCDFDQSTAEVIDEAIDFYSPLNAGQLVDLSHAKDGPWYVVWNHGGKINPGMKIDNTKILEFYSKAIPAFGIQ